MEGATGRLTIPGDALVLIPGTGARGAVRGDVNFADVTD